MNKIYRLLLAVLLLAGILLAVGSKIAWATPATKQPDSAPAKVNNAPGAVEPIGSVRAPNCNGVTVKDDQIKNICGVALLTGAIGTDVFASLDPIPSGFYSQAVTLFFKSGGVQICFAAPDGGTLFFKPLDEQNVWTLIPTDISQGLACATVTASGSYALGPVPTPTPAP